MALALSGSHSIPGDGGDWGRRCPGRIRDTHAYLPGLAEMQEVGD
jgi:hypothetical protein